MFAAMPSDTDRELEFFRLALLLIESGAAEVPAPLSLHFDSVLKQARLLLANPQSISPEVIPQAVHLANDLRMIHGLDDSLSSVCGIKDVSQEIAHNVLLTLEPNFAPAD
ncbi:hypothetical protein [Brevundimonas nasdae]|uniref:hypothetical protein n=1 Tax=Brevundimonas nasdae TaxID=172043 RepID=UPI003F68EDBD